MMPGSSAFPSNASPKAKVTSATTNGNIFVRPVAVAGIFCPVNDSDSKPPALPEKRRFSALVGDLRPCSSEGGPGTEDFNRRRQSWDTRQKEAPFGQALLRKTPRANAGPSLKSVKPEEKDNKAALQERLPSSDVITNNNDSIKSYVSSTTLVSSQSILAKESSVTSGSKNANSSLIDSETKGDHINVSCNSTKFNNSVQVVAKKVPDSNITLSSNNSVSDDSSNVLDKNETEIQTTTENSKQPKKVYGLIKRDSKSNVINIQTDNVADKNVALIQNKTKVYGVNKNIIKKDTESVVQENQQVQKLTSEKNVPTKDSKAGLQMSPGSNDTQELLNEKKINRPSVSPPKEFRTVRRTSDVIAAKIQNIFSNFQSDKSVPSSPRKSQNLDKRNSSVILKEDSAKTGTEVTKAQIGIFSKKESSNVSETAPKLAEKDNNSKGEKSNSLKPNTSSENQVDHTKLIEVKSHSKISSQKSTSNSDSKSEKQPSTKNASLEKQDRGVVSIQSLKIDFPSKSTVSKIESSIVTLPSKQQDKNLADIEGKMPTKKADQKFSGGSNLHLITSNGEVDRKSSDSSLNASKENTNKEPEAKKQTASMSNIASGISCEGSTNTSQSLVLKTLNSSTNNKPLGEINEKKTQSHSLSKESYNSATSVTHSFVATNSLLKTSYSNSGVTNSNSSFQTGIQNSISSKTVSNGNAESTSTEISKVEVTKITPSTIPGIVPTVNVLFRTRSPQGVTNRDENRKKVVIETYANETPISSSVIINPSAVKSSSSTNATDSVKETFKAIEDVQKSLNASPSVPKKHAIVNLKKEEVAIVSLTPNSNNSESEKTASSAIENGSSLSISHLNEKTTNCDDFKSLNASDKTTMDRKVTPDADRPEVGESKSFVNGYVPRSFSSSSSIYKEEGNDSRSFGREAAMSVVDLGDWSKKFQSSELEAPRAPLRRRALRDSLPPSLPLRSVSRYGSLKRVEDSPRYLPRSPSQSSLPQRYSYTEMLSKVCSMGVLPYSETMNSKSCSSSSSQVSELWSELSEEQSTATHASEMLEAETSERMRLEKEVHELQNRYSQVQQRSDKMEMEMIETRMYRSPEINGDLSDDDEVDGNSSIYKQKYERAVRDMEIMKRRMQQQQEEDMEQKAMMKKASEKKLADAMEDVEEERQVANQWKRKAQKLGAELQDLRLMLEEQMGRNGELEKKQRRFDAELSTSQEEIKKERLLREKLSREKDQAISEKYSLEQELQSSKLDSDMLHEKITQLNRELDELTLSSKGEEEVTQLKRAKQELERKSRDQEEELEELAAQVQMLEQAKLRLEMSLEKIRQEHRREASVREEEIEEIRASFSKKLKNIEAQLESEQDERHQLMKQKHELERRIYELADQPPPQDPEIERRLRRDLKRTKALLRDAQSMLEHTREGQSSKTLIRQLKNQLEDSEFAKATAVKARQAIETELQECQLQLEEVTRVKNEAESRCLQLAREKSAIQTQLEEAEEEMAEVMKKYKAVVAQMSIDQKALAEQNQQIAELETERQMLKDQLSEVSHKFEHLAGQSDDTHKVHWLDSKIRDLESKLELEQTTKTRLENQIARLKEQNDRSREECDSLRNKEMQAQEGVRRIQRQLRDLREDYSAIQQKEADAYRKQHELEMALENTETDLQVTKNDLRLACQRIQDLQNALEDDLDSGTDVPDDSGSDSDESFELAVLRNQSVTPTPRCDSVASNLSYCTTEDVRSRTSSFSRELSAFSRMMLRRTSMDFLG